MQVPLWLLSSLQGLDVFGLARTAEQAKYGEYEFVPKVAWDEHIFSSMRFCNFMAQRLDLPFEVESFTVSFDPTVLQEPVAVVQLQNLGDVGLLASLLQYVTRKYTPPSPSSSTDASGLEMRASMYSSMLQLVPNSHCF